MCKALEDIKKHAMKEGERRGERRGEWLGTLMTLCSLVSDGLIRLEEAAGRAGLSEEAFRSEMEKAGTYAGKSGSLCVYFSRRRRTGWNTED